MYVCQFVLFSWSYLGLLSLRPLGPKESLARNHMGYIQMAIKTKIGVTDIEHLNDYFLRICFTLSSLVITLPLVLNAISYHGIFFFLNYRENPWVIFKIMLPYLRNEFLLLFSQHRGVFLDYQRQYAKDFRSPFQVDRVDRELITQIRSLFRRWRRIHGFRVEIFGRLVCRRSSCLMVRFSQSVYWNRAMVS